MEIRQLMEECQAEIVAEYLQMDMIQKGNRKYITCPGHEARLGKPDLHIGNAELRKRGYICYACHEFVNTHDMVMEVTGCSSAEAYRIMVDAMGYEMNSNGKESMDIPRIRLSKWEASIIGLYPKFRELVNQSSEKDDKALVYDGLYELYKANHDIYYSLIIRKAEKAHEKYLFCREHYADVKADMAYVIYHLLGEKFDNSIYAKIRLELDDRIERCERIIHIFSAERKKTA